MYVNTLSQISKCYRCIFRYASNLNIDCTCTRHYSRKYEKQLSKSRFFESTSRTQSLFRFYFLTNHSANFILLISL